MRERLVALWGRRCSTLAFSLVIAATASAQELQTDTRPVIVVPQPTGPPPFTNVRGFSNDYQVGPGDLLEITVVGHDDLRQTLRISNSGEISFPMVGLISVVESTPFEIENQVATRLRDKGLVLDAEVTVFVKEYQAKPVYVSGAVFTPGEYMMSQDLTVVDAILLAGGLLPNAADEGLIHRRVAPRSKATAGTTAQNADVATPGEEVIRIDLTPMKQGQFASDAFPLRRGDVVVIPEQMLHAFFVVGEVVAPKDYRYHPGRKVLVSQAVSWAGGPLPTAKMSQGILVRYDAQGRRSELKVDYAAILNGKQPDIPILPNDIIFIPSSRMKTITHEMIGMTDLMVMQQSFRVGRKLQLPERPEPER